MNKASHCSLLSAALVAAFTSAALAQQGRPGTQMPQGSIAGTIIDGATGGPLASATVAVRSSADSSLVTGAIVDKDGTFAISGLRPGGYYARISFVGYTTRFIDVAIRPESLNLTLGDITLLPDSSLKNEVAVTARRDFMSVGIDRTVYKTADLLVSSGGNATDLLRNLPQIEVDADGNVSLRGNQNVAIQINGRPMTLKGVSLAAFLRGLPAGSVERIEVVTNPSAKYDPEGMGGIINIVMNQQTDLGLSGSISGALGSTNSHNASLNLGYGKGPWNLFGSYSFNYSNFRGAGDRYRENFLPGISPVVEQINYDTNRAPYHSFNASADYSMGSAGTLSMAAILTRRDGTGRSVTSSLQRERDMAFIDRYQRNDDGNNEGTGMDYRLGYKLVLQPSKHELTAELRYGSDDGEEFDAYTQSALAADGSQNGSVPSRQNVTQKSRYDVYALQLDYVRQLWDGSRLEAGYKGETERTGGDVISETFDPAANIFHPDLALNNSYDYDRRIHAAYGTIGQEFGDFGAQAGVRLEQAYTTFDLKTTGESFDNNYFSVFPSAFLTYKAGDELQLKASYSRRVQRPWIGALNPFVTYDDPQFRRSGNPYLKPEYTDSYEFSSSYFADGASLTLTPFYRHTTDALRRWEIVDSAGISTGTFVNFADHTSYGADLIGTVRVGEWMSAFASLSGYKTVTDASNVRSDLASEGFSWMVRGNATFTLPAGFTLQTSLSYRAPMVIEGGEMKSWSMIDFAVQKKLLEDRGRLGLRVSDPFNLSGFGFTRRDDIYYQTYSRKWSSRGVFLTFSYSFGSPNQTQRRDRGQQTAPASGGDGMMGMP